MTLSLELPTAAASELPSAPARSAARFVLRTLGAFELRDTLDPAAPPLLQRGKPLAVLAYCAAERRLAHSRDALSTLLWADAAPERSRHNVRQALWRLRKVLNDAVETRDDAVVGVRSDVAMDRDRFLEAVANADLAAAFDAYAGPFLPDVAFPGGDEFEDWARAERARLEESLSRLVETVVRAEAPRLSSTARREAVSSLIDRAPDSLEARRIAIDLALDLGDRVGAVREADRLEALAVRLEVSPTATMRATIDRARAQDAVEEPTTALFPALELVGRDEPFSAAVSAWTQVRRGETRFLLVRGVAGVGKSRLLDAIAERCAVRRAQVLLVRANLGECHVPFGFAALLARELSGLRGAAGISADSARELVALDPGLASRFAAAPTPVEPGETVRRRALALVDLIQAVAEQLPLAMLLDDLHWADDASRQVLAMVFSRVTAVPVLVLGTSRGNDAASLLPPSRQEFDLVPLSAGTVRESLAMSGIWPDDHAASDFLDTMSTSCNGLPLDVVERLTLAIEAGALRFRDGHWSSPDWDHAGVVVSASGPLERRLHNCTADERALLLAMSVAGTPLGADVIEAMSFPQEVARSLEAKGFLRVDHDGWRPVHDSVAESMLGGSPRVDLLAAHARLGVALEQSGKPERLPMALRHLVAAGEDQAACTLFAALLTRARDRGDQRSASLLLAEVLGDDAASPQRDAILRAIPWYSRSPELRLRLVVALLCLISVCAVSAAWYTWRRPALRMTQTAVVTQPAPLFGSTASRLVPSVMLQVGNANGVRTPLRTVRVRSLGSGTVLLAGDSVVADSGLASFAGLRFTSTDSIVRLRFESPGYRSVDLDVRRDATIATSGEITSIAVLGGRFVIGGEPLPLSAASPRVRVRRSTLIDGVVQLQYSSTLAAASVWVSMTPTWGDPETVGRELTPVTTPVNREVIDIPVTVQAPTTPGRHWLLFTVAAEPSGGYSLSGTNWTMNRPLWGDGNDLAQFPDSSIRAALRTGSISFPKAYPLTHRRNQRQCRAVSATLTYCPSRQAVAGIAVDVY